MIPRAAFSFHFVHLTYDHISVAANSHSVPSSFGGQEAVENMGEWLETNMVELQQATKSFDVESVLSRLKQSEKISLLSGRILA